MVFVFSSLLAVNAVAYAQPASPRVIDHADIFADGVEVVETLPVLTYDNTERLLWYFDPQNTAWQVYEYTVEIKALMDYQPRSDGTYLISSAVDGIPGMNAETVWLFSPNSGAVRKPSSVCNLVQALPGEGQWLLTQLPEDNLYRLCNNETGMTTKPLPDDLQHKVQRVCDWYEPFKSGIPVASPTGEWVVFHTCEKQHGPTLHVLYAYNTLTDTITSLGLADFFQYISIDHWMSDTQPIILLGEFRTGSLHGAWSADLTVSDSIKLIANQYAYLLRYFDNPPRLLWVDNEYVSDAPESDVKQTVHEYRLDTQTERQIVEHTCTFRICEAGYVVWADDEVAALWNGYPLNADFEFSIWDIHTNTKIFETNAQFADILDSRRIIVSKYDADLEKSLIAILAVTDSEVSGEVYEDIYTFYPNSISLAPDSDKALIFLDSEYLSAETDRNVFAADIYDFTSNQRTTLMEEYRSDFDFELQWLDSNLIQVDMLLQREECDWYNCMIGSWLVQTA